MWKLYKLSPELSQLPAYLALLSTLNPLLSIHTAARRILLNYVISSQNPPWLLMSVQVKVRVPENGLKLHMVGIALPSSLTTFSPSFSAQETGFFTVSAIHRAHSYWPFHQPGILFPDSPHLHQSLCKAPFGQGLSLATLIKTTIIAHASSLPSSLYPALFFFPIIFNGLWHTLTFTNSLFLLSISFW